MAAQQAAKNQGKGESPRAFFFTRKNGFGALGFGVPSHLVCFQAAEHSCVPVGRDNISLHINTLFPPKTRPHSAVAGERAESNNRGAGEEVGFF